MDGSLKCGRRGEYVNKMDGWDQWDARRWMQTVQRWSEGVCSTEWEDGMHEYLNEKVGG